MNFNTIIGLEIIVTGNRNTFLINIQTIITANDETLFLYFDLQTKAYRSGELNVDRYKL